MNKTNALSKHIHQTSNSGNVGDCQLVQLDGEWFSKISNSDRMPEFMMTLTSSSNHWMFISSLGALTAGRRNSDQAIFPYYSADKIMDTRKQTGPRTIIRCTGNGPQAVWEPFLEATVENSRIKRNLYKGPLGNKLCFEEINVELELTFRYRWTFSHNFGLVRTARIINVGKKDFEIDLIDGFQNIVPAGVGEEFQLQFGNLLDAYKKNELTETGLGVFYLSSVPTDRAEPSEGLRAAVTWATRTPEATLLGQGQVDEFLNGSPLTSDRDTRGQRGDYLLNYKFELKAGEQVDWDIVADTGLDQTDIIDLAAQLQAEPIRDMLYKDVADCEHRLAELIAKSDGFQSSRKFGKSLRHQSNVMFNIMRGGVPLNDYKICCADLRKHIAGTNSKVAREQQQFLDELPDQLDQQTLIELAQQSSDVHLLRIVTEHLPLVFGRRHGDPTRPWNKFSIESNVASDERVFHYEGNWRDIFQNWEALAYSYPQLIQGMICRFLNASTADGYNPYRITKSGFEWEKPEPANPWSNIGYWCDHQIIYLCKLLEVSHQFFPGELDKLLNQQMFVYANVPYRIKPLEQILADPQETVEFDLSLSNKLEAEAASFGNDAKLLRNENQEIQTATLSEKLLLPLLVKMSNFVPDGGVWLNTQRPEWNDANNALVGNGLSIVTTCYLRRYTSFLAKWLRESDCRKLTVPSEIVWLMNQIQLAISPYVVEEHVTISQTQRHQIVMDLSTAGSKYRSRVYEQGLSNEKVQVEIETCIEFLEQCRQLLDSTIASNKRSDGLYHAYNLMSLDVPGEIQIERLYEMLEGQVAVLSSGYLNSQQTVEVLDALRTSSLYRENQDSYLLYPNRDLPRFLEKNLLSFGLINQSPLLQELLECGDESVIRKDIFGNCHFNGDFRNRKDVEAAIEKLNSHGQFKNWRQDSAEQIGNIFESVFCHHQFTGRSGTFFAYEGLGSIYWHMVSKLLLAVAENYVLAESTEQDSDTLSSLRRHFQDIQIGLGAEKPAIDYGAFPSDPYSHTPEQSGAQQPGMTGQVKEDIISRFIELGVSVSHGQVGFNPSMLSTDEFCDSGSEMPLWDFLNSKLITGEFSNESFAFTFCGVPVVYRIADKCELRIYRTDGTIETLNSSQLSIEQSRDLFARNGSIQRIELTFNSETFCKRA